MRCLGSAQEEHKCFAFSEAECTGWTGSLFCSDHPEQPNLNQANAPAPSTQHHLPPVTVTHRTVDSMKNLTYEMLWGSNPKHEQNEGNIIGHCTDGASEAAGYLMVARWLAPPCALTLAEYTHQTLLLHLCSPLRVRVLVVVEGGGAYT